MDTYKALIESDDLMRKLIRKVNHYISVFSVCQSGDPKIAQIISDSAESRGKLLRPHLLLLSAQCGPDFEEREDTLCKLAAIVEMVHMSSLIHDDIVDDAAKRHGKFSVQHKYGKKAAVYAGDFLMSRMIAQVCKCNLNRAASILAETISEMCLGEIGQSCCIFKDNTKIAEYLSNIHGKTAALFMAACRIGAEESGCSPETVKKLEEFGECFGMAFQLRDDLLDFMSNAGQEGKDLHKDFREGIYTYPLLLVLNKKSGRKKLEFILRDNKEGCLTEAQLANMERIVVEEHGVDGTKKRLREYLDRAESIVHSDRSAIEPADKMLMLMTKLIGTI